MRFVHYGSNKFEKVWNYHQPSECLNKPAGFWGSPEDSTLNWKWFILSDWESQKKTLKKKIIFETPNAKLLIISSRKTLEKYRKKTPNPFYSFDPDYFRYDLDWDKIKSEYDGVVIYISKLTQNDLWDYNLIAYDVDSICIWNLEKVHQINCKEAVLARN